MSTVSERDLIAFNIVRSLDNLRLLARCEGMTAMAAFIDLAYAGCAEQADAAAPPPPNRKD